MELESSHAGAGWQSGKCRMEGPRIGRRRALESMAGAAALCGIPWADLIRAAPLPVPAPSEAGSGTDGFWERLRAADFLLPGGKAFLNNGSLGVVPRRVLAAVTDELRLAAEYPTDDAPRWGYETLERERDAMSGFLGCDRDELAFTHNCTEAMSFIANGLDLKAGDEVLITNQEHIGGSGCWRVKAARHGVRLREVELPATPQDPGDWAARMVDAIGPSTRVMSFSGIISHTGMIMPVREICAAARRKGVMTVVDAAHMNGQVPFNLHELGCDFCAGSPHKWLFAPAGCGYLYGRRERLEELWTTVASGSWERGKGSNATRFVMVGTNNRAIIAGMIAGMKYHQELGPERIFARQRALTDLVFERASSRPYLDIITRRDRRLFQAMVTVSLKTEQVQPVMDRLRERHVHVLPGRRLRLSCHVHTRPSDIERLFSVLDEVLA